MAKQTKHRRSKKKQKSILKELTHRRRLILIAAVATIGILSSAYLLTRPGLPKILLPSPPADALYKQADQPVEARVQDLLGRMTLDEKIGQMALVDKKSLAKTEDISDYGLGGLLSGAGAKPEKNTPQGWLDMINDYKAEAAKSRLGIPIVYGVDANHGHANVLGATVFPHAIGLGATRNTPLVNAVAGATAEELKATGVNWSYSPSLDAPKDIRWGRVYEAFSDSPALNSTLGAAYINGIQTSQPGEPNVLATAKHYLATGAMTWGTSNNKKFKIDQGKTVVDEQALNNEYLPPYQAAVQANVSSVMVGLNQWGDQRMIDSKYLLTDKLKNQLGFKGFIVSDWYGVYEFSGTNKYKATVTTINAGLDMAMLPFDYKSFSSDVRKAVKKGDISQSRIDDAVSRILTQKFKAGLFDTVPKPVGIEAVGSAKNRQLARSAVAASAVLLKNNDSLLPLSKNTGHVLVAGSGADNVGRQSGAWTVEWQGVDGNWLPGSTSILQGIRQNVSKNTVVDYNQAGIFGGLSQKADVGIVVVSEKPYAEGWGDNANPTVSDSDLAAIKQMQRSSNKVVVVMLSGRPLLITNQISSWDAAVEAWLPGSEGEGVADVLFGNQPFSGKLPLPWPANIQQLPISSDGTTKNGTKPLFESGFGL